MEYKIIQDEDAQDPRGNDNLGTMVCWHGNYILGDDQPDYSVGVWLHATLCEFGLERTDQHGYYTEQWEDFVYDLENDDPDSIRKAWSLLEDKIFVLPLYLYDHSGLSISTTRHWSIFDSGQVGFIYVTKEDVRSEWGKQRISKQLEDRILDNLRSEVQEYNSYLSGDCWGYVITDRHGDTVDSCWGFLGYEYCKQEAEQQMEYYQREEVRELIQLQSVNREFA